MPDWLFQLLLPATDRAVAIQWSIMAPLWVIALWWSRRLDKDQRHFVTGLVIANLAWFAARTVH